MLLGSTEPSEDLHHVVNFLFFFGPSLIKPILFLQVKQFSTNDKFLPSNPLSKLMVVDINETELHFLLFFTIVIVKLHLSQQQLSIVIVLNLEVSSFGHVAHYLSRIGS